MARNRVWTEEDWKDVDPLFGTMTTVEIVALPWVPMSADSINKRRRKRGRPSPRTGGGTKRVEPKPEPLSTSEITRRLSSWPAIAQGV